MDALSVLFLTPLGDQSGDAGFFRVTQPARRLAARADVASVHVASNFDPNLDALLEAADVIVVGQLADPDLFPRVSAARERGAVVVFDLAEDLTSLPLLHPLQGAWVEEQSQRHAFKLAKLATLFTASNVRLLAHWASVNLRGNLVEEAWPLEVVAERVATTERFHIVFHIELHEYAGAREVVEAVRAWLTVAPHATVEVLSPEIVHQGFEGFPADRLTLTTTRDPLRRAEALQRADVAILTLDESDYSHRTSDLRWLEAAANGAIVLAPKRGAYADRITHGANGIHYREPDEVIPALDRLSNDVELCAHVRRTAADQVRHERSLDASLDEQVRYWRRFLKVDRSKARTALPPREGGTLSAYEHALYEGIFAMSTLKDHAAARVEFERASELEPGSAEPPMLLARVCPNPVAFAVSALEKAPSSLRGHVLLGDALQDAGQHQDALAIYQRTAELFPSWELPYLRVALLLEGLGMKTESEQFIRMAADVATFLEEAVEARA